MRKRHKKLDTPLRSVARENVTDRREAFLLAVPISPPVAYLAKVGEQQWRRRHSTNDSESGITIIFL